MKDIKLYVVTHKEINKTLQDRTVIGVGSNRNLKCVNLYDNSGENIEEKNSSYCELTALYWIWKNDNPLYVGLEHYRRYFCTGNPFKAKPLNAEKILKKLKKYDIILPKKSNLRMSVYARYKRGHVIGDMETCKDIIHNDFPEYSDDFEFIMNEHKIFMTNMFVARKELIDEYCKWLFHILFEAEKRISLEGRNQYQSRAFGFLSERLFNVWVRRHKLKIYYAKVYNLGDRPLLLKFKGLLKRLKIIK